MQKYATRTERLALIAEMAGLEKTRMVHDEGVGTDIPMTLFGWRDGQLLVTAQTPLEMVGMPQERFHVVAASAFAIRRALGATSFTLLVEGFVSAVDKDTELAQCYADGDTDVSECVWLTQQDVGESEMIMMALPYRYDLRDVVFSETLEETVPLASQGAYCHAIQHSLNAAIGPVVKPKVLARELRNLGMMVQTF